MWQRIQTLYFAICVALVSVLVFGPVCTDFSIGESIPFLSKTPYAVLGLLALACNAVALFAFGRRAFQLRLAAAAAVVLAGLQIWLAVDYFRIPQYVFRWTAILPLVCVMLDIFAIRGIFADELLVRSSRRLRSAKNRTGSKKQ